MAIVCAIITRFRLTLEIKAIALMNLAKVNE